MEQPLSSVNIWRRYWL